MPRKYNRAHSSKNYKKHNEDDLKKAAEEISKGASFRKTSQKYCIPVGVLHRYAMNHVRRKHGGQTILSPAEEEYFISRIITCPDWGYPLTSSDLRLIVKAHFDRKGTEQLKPASTAAQPEPTSSSSINSGKQEDEEPAPGTSTDTKVGDCCGHL